MKIFDVFISYRRSDGQTKAKALNQYLTEKGLRVFFDEDGIEDGDFFTTQIEEQLRVVPNYVLVATDDVFRFRQGEDWVREEMRIALEMYEKAPQDRNIVVLTEQQVQFPLKEALPAQVCKIADVQRVVAAEDLEAAFLRVFNAVTQVNHQNLWRAAHRWLENSKRPGGRFANLSIVESILPNAGQEPGACDIPVNVSDAPTNGHTKALFDAVFETRDHLFLIGQGGIGKTTALMHLMNGTYAERYNRNARIPIFVELSFAPDVYDTLYEGGKSSFIRRSIYKQLRTDRTLQQMTEEAVSDIDEAYILPYKVAVEPINDIFSRTSPAPEYLLLLDGLNEVSTAFVEQANATVTKMIAEEINMLMTRCPNVRVVLTSRSDETSVSDQPMRRLYLSGVDEDAIRKYLQERQVTNIDQLMRNRALVQTLKTPLFLTLYGSLTSREEISSQGEIFRLFFHERRENISIYTVQDRLSELEENIRDTAGRKQRNRLTASMQYFILDFLLPEIAWHMERQGQFYLRPGQIAQIIAPVLEDRSDIAVCGEFGKDLFAKYREGSAADSHTQSVAEDILQRLGPDISKCAEKIINCCTLALGILQRSGRKYGFIHQHIRDYFAALKNINTMRLALFMLEEQEPELALACINTVFRDAPAGHSVRKFMGQYLGEHHNSPVFRDGAYHDNVDTTKEDRTLISRTLDIYRGYFAREGGYGQYTLLKIMSEVRGSLMGCDLSQLDLSGCQLNGAALGRVGLAANLDGAKLLERDLFFNGHTDPIYHFDISPDGSKMLTGTSKEVRIWNMQTGGLLNVYNRLWELEREKKPDEEFNFFDIEIPLTALQCAQFIDNDTILLVMRDNSQSGVRIRKKDLILGPDIEFFGPQLRIESVQLSTDRTRLVLFAERENTPGSEVLVFNTADLQPVFHKSFPNGFGHTAFMTGDNRQLLVVYSENTVERTMIFADDPDFEYPSVRSFLETWDISSGTCIKTQFMKPQLNTRNKIVCNDKLFLIRQEQRNQTADLLVLDLQTGALLKTIPLPSSRLYSIFGGRTGSIFAVVVNGLVHIYDTADCQLLRVIRQHTYQTFFGPEDKTLALANTDGSLHVYEYPLMDLKTKLTGAASSSGEDRVTFCADTGKVATITGAGDLRLWDVETARLVDERSVSRIYNGVLESSHDGKYLYYHGKNRSHIYRTSDLVRVYSRPVDLCIHPQGRYLAALQGEDSIILNPENYHKICFWRSAGVCAFAGELAVVKEYTGELTERTKKSIWRSLTLRNVQTDEICAVFAADPDEYFTAVAVSDRLITAISNNSLYVWDLHTRALVFKHEDYARDDDGSTLEFSGDGKLLFLHGGFFTSSAIYETENFKVAMRPEGVMADRFRSSPSGKLLIEINKAASHGNLRIFKADGLSDREDRQEGAAILPFRIDSTKDAVISRDDKYLAAIANGLYLGTLEESTDDPNGLVSHTIASIPQEPGLQIMGVDLRNLHPDTYIYPWNQDTLWHYGAMVDLPEKP